MTALAAVGIMLTVFIMQTSYSAWVVCKHAKATGKDSFLALALLFTLVALVSGFIPSPAQLFADSSYGLTVFRGALEEAIKVFSLLALANIPANVTRLPYCRNPVWIMAVTIAFYENVAVMLGPLGSSVTALITQGMEHLTTLPAVTVYQPSGLLALTATCLARVWVHYYLTMFAVHFWQRGCYRLMLLAIVSHGVINLTILHSNLTLSGLHARVMAALGIFILVILICYVLTRQQQWQSAQ